MSEGTFAAYGNFEKVMPVYQSKKARDIIYSQTTLQYPYKMNSANENDTYTHKDRFIKCLHFIMIALCVLATFVLYNNPSTGIKLLISILLIVYTFTIICNSRAVKLIFKIGQNQTQHSYRNVHKWKIDEEGRQKQKQDAKDRELTPNETNFPWNRKNNESYNNQSFSKSERSQQIKNMSMSIYRSLSASGINDSRVSRIKSSKRVPQLKGYDLSEAFTDQHDSMLDTSTIRSQGSGIVLVDSHTYLSNKTEKYLEDAEEKYEKILKKKLKKDRKFMGRKYESILHFTRTLVKSYINEHKFASDKLKQLCKQYLDLILLENSFNSSYDIPLKKGAFNTKLPYNVLIYKLLLIKQGRIKFAEAGLPIKAGLHTSSIQPRFEECLRTMIRLAHTLGVDNNLLKSKHLTNFKEFIQEYFEAIEMLETYSSFESKEKRSDQVNNSTLCYWSKCRTFVLYLMVRHLNNSLKYAGKVKFNDNLNLLYAAADHYSYEIIKRPGTEDPLIHYDLSILDDGKQKEKINCQPGERNYLSVLYFLLQDLSTKVDLLSWNVDLKQLVNQIA